MSQRPLPVPIDETRHYWESARAGRLVVQKCNGCGALQFYPRAYCMSCMEESVGWIEASGKGTIYTYTINHRAANDAMKDRTPYAVAAVDLDEGVRMIANIVDCDLGDVRCGARVRVVFEKLSDEITLPQFTLDA